MKNINYKKMFSTFVLSTTLLTIISPLLADTVITCDQDNNALSHQFAEHWSHEGSPWWSSWAHDPINSLVFIGGMRSVNNTLPADQNPHLSFTWANADYNSDYEMFEVECVYRIGNANMQDQSYGLAMRALVSANTCNVTGATITCK